MADVKGVPTPRPAPSPSLRGVVSPWSSLAASVADDFSVAEDVDVADEINVELVGSIVRVVVANPIKPSEPVF